MKLSEAYELLHSEFKDARPINGVENITQSGLFLIFEGVNRMSATYASAEFSLVLSAHSLEKDNFKALKTLEQLQSRVADITATQARNGFKSTRLARFEGSLYLYAIFFNLEVELF